MDVSIIIVNYNTIKLTKQTILSVQKLTKNIIYEIILVDNASIDGSKEFFKDFKNLKYIYLEKNVGFGQANNIGVKYSQGKYIFLLNSDTILLNNAINEFYNFFVHNHDSLNIGVLGGFLYSPDNKLAMSFVNFKSIKQNLFVTLNRIKAKLGIFKESFQIPKHKNYLEVDGVLGADMFMKRNLFLELGGFDCNIFLYGEETEFQKRVKDLGLKNYCIANPKIVHLEGGSSGSNTKRLSAFTIMQLKFGDLYFINKHYSFMYYCLFVFLQLITWLPFIMLDSRFDLKDRKRAVNMLFCLKKYKFQERVVI